jgi:ABC-type sugar transport system substrate-binding protein
MHLLSNTVRSAALAALSLSLLGGVVLASDNKIAVAPGGPHPYFAPWEQAAADSKKDFGIADVEYKVPTAWKLELQTELLESLASQGFKGFGIFPGDPVGVNSTITELKGAGIPVAALGGCTVDPTDAVFCFATDPYKTTYTMTKALIAAMGGKGNIVHLTGLLIDTNTTLREQAVQKAVDETNGAVKLLQTVADTDAEEAGDRRSTLFSRRRRTRSTASSEPRTSLRTLRPRLCAQSGINASSTLPLTTARRCWRRSRTASRRRPLCKIPTDKPISAPSHSTSLPAARAR